MKRFRILFDGVEILETPGGWEDITSVMKRVKRSNSLFQSCEATLTFREDGYDYLKNLKNIGFGESVNVELQELCNGLYEKFFDGIIFIRTSKEVNCEITVSVEDNSFYSKIDNNQDLEFFPFGERTKNNLPLDPCDYEQLILFKPLDGTTVSLVSGVYTGAAYSIYKLFEYAIQFMTDTEVNFTSNVFGPGGEYEGMTLTCGTMLRTYSTTGTTEAEFKDDFSKTSFSKLWNEANKKVKIGMVVSYSGNVATVRIDRWSALHTNATMLQAPNVLEIEESYAEDEMYSSIRIGSTTISDKTNPLVHFNNDISFVGPKEEQFIILTKANLQNELNLVSEYIIDTNIIEDCLIHGETDFNKDLIWIMCDVAGGTYTAQQNNLENEVGAFPVFYNLNLYGKKVMENYFDAIPNSIAQYFGPTNNTFSAINNSDQPLDDFSGSVSKTLLFPTDVVDLNNLWDGTYYTVSNNGIYSFIINFRIGVAQAILEFELFIDRLDGGLSLISSELIHTETFLQFIEKDISASGSISANAGEFIRIRIRYSLTTAFNPTNANVEAGATIECSNTSDGGGIYKKFDPDRYPVINHKWQYPLTLDDYKLISTVQTGQVEFAKYGEPYFSGWIDELKFKRFSDEKGKFITYRAKVIPVANQQPPEVRYIFITGPLADNPFTITPDIYGKPTGGNGTAIKAFFYLVGDTITITIPTTYLNVPSHPTQPITILKFTTGVAIPATTTYPTTTATFTIEKDSNYRIQLAYDLTTLGETYPFVEPVITPPVNAGDNGSATIVLINPNNPADYTFAWTGPNGFTDSTSSIVAGAGNYTCVVTYVPGTFDHNTITFHIQIPISETGQ